MEWIKQTHQSTFFHGLSACFSTAKCISQWLSLHVCLIPLQNLSRVFGWWVLLVLDKVRRKGVYIQKGTLLPTTYGWKVLLHIPYIDQHTNLKNRYLISVMQQYPFLPAHIQCLRHILVFCRNMQSPCLPSAKDSAALHYFFHIQQETPTREKGLGSWTMVPHTARGWKGRGAGVPPSVCWPHSS